MAGFALAVATAGAQDLYKWVDAQGNVTYQDQPPPGQEDSAAPFAEDSEVVAELAAEKARRSNTSSVPVMLYSVPVCDACDMVRLLLEKNGVPYTEMDADDNAAVQNEIKELTGQLSVPVLTVGENVVSGYSSTSIEAQLISAGYTLGGKNAPGQEQPPAGSPLSLEEITEQAAAAAAKLTADLQELTSETSLLDNLDDTEEIPEDEQIKVRTSE